MGNSNQQAVEMPHGQAADLIWFFGPGQCVFEKSTCGSMLEALERASSVSKTCHKCKGHGILGADDWTDPNNGEWCSNCRGTGTLPVANRRSKGQLTARPKSAVGTSNAKTPDDKALTRYASVSRRINRLQESSPESVQILAAYYGNAGTRWSQTIEYTRLFPVLVLTQAGKTLIRKFWNPAMLSGGDKESGADRDAHEQLGLIHKANRMQNDPVRAKLFVDAFVQAEKLVELATISWLGTEKR